MTSPVATTYVDIERIGFERSKGGGLLSWLKSTDRTESVDGFECKVSFGFFIQFPGVRGFECRSDHEDADRTSE